MRALLIAVAGAAGALVRYGIGSAVGARSFPWATLAINLTGSFVLAGLLTAATMRGWSTDVVAPLAIGFLGAYTTFSTFSYETWTMLRTDRATAAAAYVAISVIGGLLAAGAGYAVGRAA